mgnify:CR=1 FL=1
MQQVTPAAFVLLGPTASGKTAASLYLAARYPVEIISMDSALVYRGMDIGSAKPTPEERALCPHHLLDVRDIGETYSAADFAGDAIALVEQIRARGRIPLIVGGTMLYYKALAEGLNEMPSTDVAVRNRVLAEAEALGWPAMHAKLSQIDPATAERLAPNDSQRISRALEVFEMTGRTLTSFHREQVKAPLLSLSVMGLMLADRALLHARIAERFSAMLKAGFLDEVRALMARADFDRASPAMRAVGYRQAIEHLLGERSFSDFVNAGIAATRQLAKRQMTWMRSMPGLEILDPTNANAFAMLQRAFERMLAGH